MMKFECIVITITLPLLYLPLAFGFLWMIIDLVFIKYRDLYGQCGSVSLKASSVGYAERRGRAW